MIPLENIVKGAVNSGLGRLLLGGIIAASTYACDGKATSMPTTEPTMPAPTATQGLSTSTPEASEQPASESAPENSYPHTPELVPDSTATKVAPTLFPPPPIPTPTPTNTPIPTPLPTPTYTPGPTPTPIPTPTSTPIPTPTATPVPLPDLQITNIKPNFLGFDHNENKELYSLTFGGTYGETRPDKPFDIKVFGLERIIENPVYQVTRINNDRTFLLEIPGVKLSPGVYSIYSEVDSGRVIIEKKEDNNESSRFVLEVKERPTFTEEEYNYFKNAVGTIKKFKDGIPVYVQFYGSATDKTIKPSEESMKNFKDGAADIEKATNVNLSFRYTEPPAGAPVLKAYLEVPHPELSIIFPTYITDDAGGAAEVTKLTPDGYIKEAKIAVATKVPTWPYPFRRKELNFTILHELINVSGAPIDQDGPNDPLDSILNDEAGGVYREPPQKYSPLDLKVFEILYLPGVEPRMGPRAVKDKVIRVIPSN